MTNNKQQTAVEWLFEQLPNKLKPHLKKELQQAKEMEKEQIIEADLNATIRTAKGANADVSVRRVKELGEQYYNETFGGEQ